MREPGPVDDFGCPASPGGEPGDTRAARLARARSGLVRVPGDGPDRRRLARKERGRAARGAGSTLSPR